MVAANTTGLFLEDSQGVIDLMESLRRVFRVLVYTIVWG